MRTNYVLIDYENVQPEGLSMLDAEHFKVVVFIGANQKKLNVTFVAAVQRLGSRGEYVQISGSGSNALDFHIAYYIGKFAAADSAAFFHVISKDTGFDPLLRHLKDQKISAARAASIHEIKIVKVAAAKPADLIQKLAAKGYISVAGTTVSYASTSGG